jgi:hypothetical protein
VLLAAVNVTYNEGSGLADEYKLLGLLAVDIELFQSSSIKGVEFFLDYLKRYIVA